MKPGLPHVVKRRLESTLHNTGEADMNFEAMMFAQSETLGILVFWLSTPKAAIQY